MCNGVQRYSYIWIVMATMDYVDITVKVVLTYLLVVIRNLIFRKQNCGFFAEKAQKRHLFASRLLKHLPCWNRIMWSIVIRHMFLLSPSASFTSYAAKGFSENEQRHLAELAWQTAVEKRVPVLISNHATDLTYDLYQHAVCKNCRLNEQLVEQGIPVNGWPNWSPVMNHTDWPERLGNL